MGQGKSKKKETGKCLKGERKQTRVYATQRGR